MLLDLKKSQDMEEGKEWEIEKWIIKLEGNGQHDYLIIPSEWWFVC